MSETIPQWAHARLDVCDVTGRLEAVEAIRALRLAVVTENPLGPRNHHLVQFAQLVVLGHRAQAVDAAAAARRAGATPSELVGVVETALLSAGMPAYDLGMAVLADLLSVRDALLNTHPSFKEHE